VRLGNAITRIKSVFKYALDNALIGKAPRFGLEFNKPEKAVLRRRRAQNGEKMLEACQLRRLVETAAVPLKAMVLLGINAGFGNHDVATLPLAALDLDRGWLNYPRPKTGIARRCPLWPETVTAIREALAKRPAPKDKADADLVFLMSTGRGWVRVTEKSRTDNLSVHIGALMKTVEVHREGLNFYALRHTFRTVADAARDPVAIDLLMGHTDPSMGGHYRERLEDSRLLAVTEHVRVWLFDDTSGDETTDEQESRALEICEPCEPLRQDDADARPTLRLFVG
jgi:integrase